MKIKFVILSVCICFFFSSPVFAQSDLRPNILVLMSDNQYVGHMGAYGDKTVRTPNIDAVATAGVRFLNAFCAAPSCTPSRAGFLTGQDIWRLEEGANLWGTLPLKFTTYPDLLEKSGYIVGYSGKGWGPGNFEVSGRERNPGGNSYNDFSSFLKKTKGRRPWTFWFSSKEPHRPYVVGSGKASGISLSDIKVPPYLPDTDSVRSDIADYYAAIETFDKEVKAILQELKKSGQYDNTVIVISSDNGWQMPRGLANLYDFGSHIPLIINYPKWASGRVYSDFLNLNDLAPTFLELAGISIPPSITAKSLLPLLTAKQLNGIVDRSRDAVYMARERHAFVRENGLGYPGRAIRTNDFLYIRNYEPERWPAGDPPLFGDVDAHMLHYPSSTKVQVILDGNTSAHTYFNLAYAKRPAEELYDLKEDPYQLKNVAEDVAFQSQKKALKDRLLNYLLRTGDPREANGTIIWDFAPYYKDEDKTPRPSFQYRQLLSLDTVYHYLPHH